mmetsp:Transcript_20218/g.49082  ORF Transcript_20218/g.49082 Transcript_20218/m.49082 type:complete len:239 (+) Transcript_20218:530-1246(+)
MNPSASASAADSSKKSSPSSPSVSPSPSNSPSPSPSAPGPPMLPSSPTVNDLLSSPAAAAAVWESSSAGATRRCDVSGLPEMSLGLFETELRWLPATEGGGEPATRGPAVAHSCSLTTSHSASFSSRSRLCCAVAVAAGTGTGTGTATSPLPSPPSSGSSTSGLADTVLRELLPWLEDSSTSVMRRRVGEKSRERPAKAEGGPAMRAEKRCRFFCRDRLRFLLEDVLRSRARSSRWVA